LLDLDYVEDRAAETGECGDDRSGQFIEVRRAARRARFSPAEFAALVAGDEDKQLGALQKAALR